MTEESSRLRQRQRKRRCARHGLPPAATTLPASHCQLAPCAMNRSASMGEREGETFLDLTRRTISISSEEGESSGQSSVGGSVVDLTHDSGVEDTEFVDLTSPMSTRWRRRRRRRGDDIVVVDESDDSADEVQIMEHSPEGSMLDESKPHCTTNDKIKCPVCMEFSNIFEKRGAQVVVTTCGHVFCNSCIRRSIQEQHKCPTCRKKLNIRQFHALYLNI